MSIYEIAIYGTIAGALFAVAVIVWFCLSARAKRNRDTLTAVYRAERGHIIDPPKPYHEGLDNIFDND